MYRLFLTREFDRCLDKMPGADRDRVEKKILAHMGSQLRQEPHFGLNVRKLRGYDPETWRYRIGDLRVFYAIDEQEHIVKLLSVEQRKDAYR